VKAEEARRTLLNHCAEPPYDWHDRPIATIRPAEIQHLCSTPD
jgi:hypothetical protein